MIFYGLAVKCVSCCFNSKVSDVEAYNLKVCPKNSSIPSWNWKVKISNLLWLLDTPIHTVGIHDDVFCKKRCSLFENPVMIACWVALCPGKLLKDYATEVRCWVVRTIAYQHGKLFPGHCQFFRRSNEGRGTLVVHLEPTLTLPEILQIVVQRGIQTRPFFLQFGITFGWECDVLIMKKGKKKHEISLWLTRNESWWWRF